MEDLFKKIFGKPSCELREDQVKALNILSNEAHDIINSKEKILFCCLRISEPDLFKDRPVYLTYNIARKPLKNILSHAYKRIVLEDRLSPDDLERGEDV